MWWIHKKDQASYEKLMRQEGAEPRILQEDGDNVQVVFTNGVLNIWQMCGYWIG